LVGDLLIEFEIKMYWLMCLVFVLIASLWRQVEYWSKSLAPWENMKAMPAASQDSILLDYIDPMQPVALWISLRKKHWAVSAAISISLLLNLLVS
jgi:hypothetical protein